ncbi:MAG TPA: ribonuclease HI family protein [Actinomycetota bacterium]|nr:ribonuclease HI family protein [Actinomycetota bacterium]
MTARATLHADGGARGNPGPAGIGVVLTDDRGDVVAELGRGIGATTNNVAEYEALIAGLQLARDHGVARLRVLLDSKLVVEQMAGRWKIKNDRLRVLAVRAQKLMRDFEHVSIQHVGRARNARADALANLGMDEAESDPDDGGDAQGSLLG